MPPGIRLHTFRQAGSGFPPPLAVASAREVGGGHILVRVPERGGAREPLGHGGGDVHPDVGRPGRLADQPGVLLRRLDGEARGEVTAQHRRGLGLQVSTVERAPETACRNRRGSTCRPCASATASAAVVARASTQVLTTSFSRDAVPAWPSHIVRWPIASNTCWTRVRA